MRKIILGMIPFLLIIIGYHFLADARHEQKKLKGEEELITPYYSKIFKAANEYTFEKTATVFSPFMSNKEVATIKKEQRKACLEQIGDTMSKRDAKKHCKSQAYQESRLWNDIKASGFRMIVGITIAVVIAFPLGLILGLFKTSRELLSPFIVFLSIIPPLSLLPAFLLTLGTGEIAKIALIVVGLVFLLTRDIEREVLAFPTELKIKAMTLGASNFDMIFRIIAPQMMPIVLNMVCLQLGAAWLFLLASEAMAAQSGLGYTIYLSQRYLAMDVIIFYVMVITFLGFLLNKSIKMLNVKLFPWYAAINGGK